MITIRAADEIDLTWFQHEVGCYLTANANGIVADEDNRTLAMIALDDWTPRSVHLHFYQNDVRAMPLLWKELLWYIQAHDRKLLCAVTPSSRELSLKLQRALGFKEVYRLKDGWDDGIDLVLTELKVDAHGNEQRCSG